MSSVSPSAKNSCSATPLMLVNGSTMIDGFAWRDAPCCVTVAGEATPAVAPAAMR